ncbi:MAG: Coenzyme F420 hydrogenase/dehydrogenase, beta subunit C-terminal domain [Deltaproteobacteria bacterium]|nr:Coenzyme F420 hydrogenase/dehydrogenase, beta subunit C-terminal domain [Deltaproteobacteria bacterium]
MKEAEQGQFKKTFERMVNEVVSTRRCCGCSMCVVTCPYGVIKYDPVSMSPYVAKPKGGFAYCPISEEVGCDVCANACGRLGSECMKPIKPEEIDVRVFGRSRREDEPYGVMRFMCVVRSTNSNVVTNAQDGGAVTEILRCAFNEGIIEGAAVAGPSDKMWLDPVPRVVKSADELIQTAKSWYTYCATPMALKEAVDKHKLKKLALVGVPCEISGYATTLGADTNFTTADRGEKNIEKQNRHLKQYVEAVQVTLGLFCSETFVFERFVYEYLQGKLGINPQDVVKVNVKGKLIIDLKDGARIEAPLAEAKAYKRAQCNYCGDFSAEHADISAGGLGTAGWTMLIIRSVRGEEILKRTIEKGYLQVKPVSEFEHSMRLLKRLTETQRKRAEEQYREFR